MFHDGILTKSMLRIYIQIGFWILFVGVCFIMILFKYLLPLLGVD